MTHCVEGTVNIRATAGRLPTSQKPLVLPTVLTRKVVVDRTLGSAVITPAHLSTTCSHCPEPFRIIYSVISAPTQGRLVHASSTTEVQTLASFSQRDLDLGYVIYQHVDSAHLSDSVHLSNSIKSRDDDVIWSSDLQLEIETKPSGTEILLSVHGSISVVEGERAFVTENQLSIHRGDHVNDVEIVVVRLPVHGRIQVIRRQELRSTCLLYTSPSPRD